MASSPIAILGAGSLGRLWGGYLPGSNVGFLARPSTSTPQVTTASPAQENALHYRLIRADRTEKHCEVPWLTGAETPPSMILVATKAGDTLKALHEQLPHLPTDTPIVLLQNGMGSQAAVAETWQDRPILAASTTEGANRPTPDLLVHAGRGETWIGGLNIAGTGHVESVVSRLQQSGLTVHPETDIHHRLWNKLVINAGINAFTTILDCPNGDIVTAPFFLEHIDGLSREISAIMGSQVSEPLSPGTVKERIIAVANSTANNTSSMRSDRQRGRRTEIDVINSYLVATGAASGIPTPVNRMLTQQVKELTENSANAH